MKYIDLTNSEIKVIVSDEDYERVTALKLSWSVYKKKSKNLPESIRAYSSKMERTIILSRFILNLHLEAFPLVDHKDRNIFNNQRNNLRVVNRSESVCNRGKFKNNVSGCTGVYFDKRNGLWFVVVSKNKRRYSKRHIKTFEEAVSIRNNLVIQHHKEFAVVSGKN